MTKLTRSAALTGRSSLRRGYHPQSCSVGLYISDVSGFKTDSSREGALTDGVAVQPW